MTATLALASVAHACDVPVFRYALERWHSDPFQLVVFHQGQMDGALEAELKKLEADPNPDSRKVTPNWQIVRIDTTKEVPKLWQAVWQPLQKQSLPVAALCAPEWRMGEEPLWSGALTTEVLHELAHSPKREEVAKLLLAGKAVIWLVIESGKEAKDQALMELLKTESETLTNTIPVPRNLVRDGINVLTDLPIEANFTIVFVRANDPQEQMLLRLLTNGEPVTEPLVYPIFGRGRALAQFKGGNLNKGLLEETARFLCGACSCQVKAQNPGFDMLMTVRWEDIFGDQVPPPDERMSSPGGPQLVPIPTRKKAKP
jgi:hypothetical protein